MGILLFVLKYMYIFLLLKMINGFSWPAKIMVSPFKAWFSSLSHSLLSANVSGCQHPLIFSKYGLSGMVNGAYFITITISIIGIYEYAGHSQNRKLKH